MTKDTSAGLIKRTATYCLDCHLTFNHSTDADEADIVSHELAEGHRTRPVMIVTCSCGTELVCDDGFLNTCDRCRRDYNGAGQLLAPRSQWGEETGETAADIISGRGEGGEL